MGRRDVCGLGAEVFVYGSKLSLEQGAPTVLHQPAHPGEHRCRPEVEFIQNKA